MWGEVWATRGGDDPPFGPRDAIFLEAISSQFAVAIARAELFSKVSRLAYEDPLTGLPNRRAFDERIERALRRAGQLDVPITILLCDLDGLKQINDTEGHDAGDHALRGVAQALVAAGAAYPGAFVARLAGDEFCVLLEDQPLASALALGADALDALGAERSGRVSISCGAAWSTFGEAPRSASDLLKDADTALYISKRQGGSRVCSAEDSRGMRDANLHLNGSDPTNMASALAAATDALVADLDTRLANAPALDRLEQVARTYAQIGNIAYWFVSKVDPESDTLVDLSAGDNREHDAEPVRVSSGAKIFPLANFPVTERAVRAGSGSFLIDRDDEHSDPAERELLAELGFESVLGAAAAMSDAVYLVELYGDSKTYSQRKLITPLRLPCRLRFPR